MMLQQTQNGSLQSADIIIEGWSRRKPIRLGVFKTADSTEYKISALIGVIFGQIVALPRRKGRSNGAVRTVQIREIYVAPCKEQV